MSGAFWRQTVALLHKNQLTFIRHPWVNGIRTLLFPIAYGIILAMLPEMVFNSTADEDRYIITEAAGGALGLALAICYSGVLDHLTGHIATERSNQTTEYLKAMGTIDFARLFSWQISFSLIHLPSWIIVAVIWSFQLFPNTNVGTMLLVHVLYGLSLVSWAIFVAVPFKKSPYIPGLVAVVVAIAMNAVTLAGIKNPTNGIVFIFSLIFPASSYMYSVRVLASFDSRGVGTPLTTSIRSGSDNPDAEPISLIIPVVASAINIFLWPLIALSVEQYMFQTFNPGHSKWALFKKKPSISDQLPPHLALSVRNLNKKFSNGNFSKKETEVIEDLTLDVPKTGIYVLLGSNGAGKSTFLSIIANLIPRTAGSVRFPDGSDLASPGGLGIVPQKNVLFNDLTCLENLKIWHGLKNAHAPRGKAEVMEDLVQLLKDADLEKKIHSRAGTLSGGQKRKLQLAIGLVGGSKFILVDECTSGVDALSRRAIWRTLTSYKDERTILLTTHFLDEADLLADNIAILAAPGRLIAEGTPVSLKRAHGEGYSLQISLTHPSAQSAHALLREIQSKAPEAYISENDHSQPRLTYRLKSRDNLVIEAILRDMENKRFGTNGHDAVVDSYDVLGPSIEDVFLKLMAQNKGPSEEGTDLLDDTLESQRHAGHLPSYQPKAPLRLSDGIRTSFLRQMMTIFRKRVLIAKSNWYTPLIQFIVIFAGTTLPLILLKQGYYPNGEPRPFLQQECFEDTRGFFSGEGMEGYDPGISIPPGDGFLWYTIFGAILALASAFPTIYVTRERRVSSVQAMQFSNGLTRPIALWCGHLLFDMIIPVIASTVLVIVAATKNGQFIQLGTFWFILILFWISAILFAYLGCLVVKTPVVAFSYIAFLQLIFYALHFVGHMLSLRGETTSMQRVGMHVTQFILGLLSPLPNVMRAGQVTINAFSMLCRGPLFDQYLDSSPSANGAGSILAYGQPILYLCFLPFIYMYFLIRADNGTIPFLGWLGRNRRSKPGTAHVSEKTMPSPAGSLESGRDNEILKVDSISKTFKDGKRENKVVDNVSMNMGHDTIYALLGPNGAGKTTTFNIIRGDLLPDCGDVFIQGTSIISDPMEARTSLGVCPQFTAVDGVLTVRESLQIYGRLKGLNPKAPKGTISELDENVEKLMDAIGLKEYADRQSAKLSGGNQRKLSLAMAVMGNPRMILIDEFSTGVDAKMKRELWVIVRTIAQGKAVIITTHSMEEASALANQVGIIARRMLATGTPKALTDQYAKYQVHFSCRTREDMVRARTFMAKHIPGSNVADDVATRFEVPLQDDSGNGLALPDLFRLLSERYSRGDGENGEGDEREWTVEQPSLETVFLKVIKDNDVRELEENMRKEKGGRGR